MSQTDMLNGYQEINFIIKTLYNELQKNEAPGRSYRGVQYLVLASNVINYHFNIFIIMILNETKKFLYKKDPLATFCYLHNGIATYNCLSENEKHITFHIPVSDMGEAVFHHQMPAKLLIRWIVFYETH